MKDRPSLDSKVTDLQGNRKPVDSLLEKSDEMNSTLLRQGNEASTFKEMVQFAELLETRPLVQLLGELPGIATMSESKFSLATNVLRRRFKKESDINRQQLRSMAEEVASAMEAGAARERVHRLFESY